MGGLRNYLESAEQCTSKPEKRSMNSIQISAQRELKGYKVQEIRYRMKMSNFVVIGDLEKWGGTKEIFSTGSFEK